MSRLMVWKSAKKEKQAAGAAVEARSAHINTTTLDRSLGYSLRRAQMSTFAEFTRFMSSFDVRPSQFSVLILVRDNPGLRQASVSKALDIQKTNLVPLLDGLQKRGLLERRTV